MARASSYTKKYRRKLRFTQILNFVMLITPIMVGIIMALTAGNVLVAQQVALIGSVAMAGVLTMLNLFLQRHLRAPIWIILLGLYVVIQEYLLPIVVCLAVVSVLDDLVMTPLIAKYKIKLEASRVIDEREE